MEYYELDPHTGFYYRTTRPGEPDIDDQSDLFAGAKHGLLSTAATASGALGLVGASTDSEGVRDAGIRGYQSIMDDIQSETRDVYRAENVDSIGDVADFVQYWLGYGVTNMLAGLGIGSLGGMAAKKLARKHIEREVAKQVEAKVAKGELRDTLSDRADAAAVLTKAEAKKWATRGFIGGVGPHAFAQELGATYGEAVALAEAEGRDVSEIDLQRVWKYGSLAGAAEFGADILTAGALRVGPLKDIFSKTTSTHPLWGRAQRGAILGLSEGGVEVTQTGLEEMGAGHSFEEANFSDPTSFFAGMIPGTAVGLVRGNRPVDDRSPTDLLNDRIARRRMDETPVGHTVEMFGELQGPQQPADFTGEVVRYNATDPDARQMHLGPLDSELEETERMARDDIRTIVGQRQAEEAEAYMAGLAPNMQGDMFGELQGPQQPADFTGEVVRYGAQDPSARQNEWDFYQREPLDGRIVNGRYIEGDLLSEIADDTGTGLSVLGETPNARRARIKKLRDRVSAAASERADTTPAGLVGPEPAARRNVDSQTEIPMDMGQRMEQLAYGELGTPVADDQPRTAPVVPADRPLTQRLIDDVWAYLRWEKRSVVSREPDYVDREFMRSLVGKKPSELGNVEPLGREQAAFVKFLASAKQTKAEQPTQDTTTQEMSASDKKWYDSKVKGKTFEELDELGTKTRSPKRRGIIAAEMDRVEQQEAAEQALQQEQTPVEQTSQEQEAAAPAIRLNIPEGFAESLPDGQRRVLQAISDAVENNTLDELVSTRRTQGAGTTKAAPKRTVVTPEGKKVTLEQYTTHAEEMRKYLAGEPSEMDSPAGRKKLSDLSSSALRKVTGLASDAAVDKALAGLATKLAEASGGEVTDVLSALRAMNTQQRVVEETDAGLAGLTPDEQSIAFEDQFHRRDNGDSGHGEVTAGGSQSETSAGKSAGSELTAKQRRENAAEIARLDSQMEVVEAVEERRITDEAEMENIVASARASAEERGILKRLNTPLGEGWEEHRAEEAPTWDALPEQGKLQWYRLLSAIANGEVKQKHLVEKLREIEAEFTVLDEVTDGRRRDSGAPSDREANNGDDTAGHTGKAVGRVQAGSETARGEGGGADYRRTKSSGTSERQVKSWLSGPISKLASWVDVEVVQHVSDLPRRKDGKPHPSEASGYISEGKIYLIADNIASRREARVTLAHEVVGHAGLEKLFGKERFENFLDTVIALIRNKESAVRDAVATVRRNYGPLDERTQAKEVLAHLAERNPNFGIVRQAIAAIRVFLAKYGIGDLNAATLNKILVDAARLTRTEVDKAAAKAADKTVKTATPATHKPAPTGQRTQRLNNDRGADTLYRRTGSVYEPPTGVLKTVAKKLKYAYRDAANKGPAVLSLHALHDLYGKQLTKLQDYYHQVSEMDQMQQAIQNAGHHVAVDWHKLTDKIALHHVMLDATMQRIHPDRAFDHPSNAHLTVEDNPAETAKNRAAHAKLSRKYRDELSDDARAVYIAARDMYADHWEQRQKIYRDLVGAAFDPQIEAATGAAKEKLIKEKEKHIKENAKQLGMLKGPYFPLRRYGQHIVKFRSDEYKKTKASLENLTGDARRAAEAKLAELKKDKAHYWTRSFDNGRDAMTLEDEVPGAEYSFAYERDSRQKDITAQGYQRVANMLEEGMAANGASREAIMSVKTMLSDMYVRTLPENTSLGAEARRQYVHGAEDNALRVFASTIERNAFYMSRLKYNPRVTQTLYDLRKQARNPQEQQVANEVLLRHNLDMMYIDQPYQNFLAKLSGIYHLFSPSYWFVNATQPWFIGAPYMAARFGMGRTASQLRSGFVDAGIMVYNTIDEGGLFADLDTSTLADAGERDMLEYLIKKGRIAINTAQDLGVLAKGDTDVLSVASRMTMWPAHQVESINRVMTALAAYRMSMEDARAAGTPTAEAVKKATAFADKVIIDTQIDYSNVNAARFMKPGAVPLGKLIFQFRKYQHAMAQLLFLNAKKAFPVGKWMSGEEMTAEEIAESQLARATLGYMVGAQFVTAGLVGLPMANVVGMVAGAFFDADDEDGDPRTWMYNALVDNVGKEMATMLVKGVPAVLLDTDISKRTGMGDLFSPLPFLRTGQNTGQEELGGILTSVGGAPASVMASFIDAGKFFHDGQWLRGVEAALPKGLKDIGKAYRYADKGITSRKGVVGLGADSFDGWDIVQRALGLTPIKESDYWDAKTAERNVTTAIAERKSRLLRDYVEAREDRDFKVVARIRKKMTAFNREHRKFRITSSDRARAYKERKQPPTGEMNLSKTADKLPKLTRFAN